MQGQLCKSQHRLGRSAKVGSGGDSAKLPKALLLLLIKEAERQLDLARGKPWQGTDFHDVYEANQRVYSYDWVNNLLLVVWGGGD
jgi:hypothetical protein